MPYLTYPKKINIRGVFRTLSNIYDEVLLRKQLTALPSYMLDRVRNTSLILTHERPMFPI